LPKVEVASSSLVSRSKIPSASISCGPVTNKGGSLPNSHHLLVFHALDTFLSYTGRVIPLPLGYHPRQ